MQGKKRKDNGGKKRREAVLETHGRHEKERERENKR